MAQFQTDSTIQSPIDKNRPIHIIGGGGVGMSALAQLLLKSGFTISASDKNGGKYLEKLGEAGAQVWTGAQPERIAKNAVIFYSSAVPLNDPERLWAVENKLEIFSRHELLRIISHEYYTIAISGTHGKTTTTGWIAYLLELAGYDPNALVGGTLVQWNSNVRMGQGKINGKQILVIEADESDESFLSIEAREVIVTNVELDHVDHYTNLNQVNEKFQKFIENCRNIGGAFFPSYEVRSLLKPTMNSYDKITEILSQITLDEKKHGFYWKSEKTDNREVFFNVGLLGLHNLWNAFAVMVFAIYHDLPVSSFHSALLNFRGVERRMQKLGKFCNHYGAEITLIDDYAHHPTEIKMVLETLKAKFENIVVVWEPHRISRMLYFNDLFQSVFENTIKNNNLFLMNIFDAAGEKDMPEFARFGEIWNQWTEKSHGVIASRGDYKQLDDHVNAINKNSALIFLGAGHSSEYALSYYEAAKPRH